LRAYVASNAKDSLARWLAAGGILVSMVTAIISILFFIQAAESRAKAQRLEARDLLYEALDLMGGNVKGTPWLYLGDGPQTEEDFRRYNRAQRNIERALILEPDDYAAHELLGLYFAQLGNLDKALQSLIRSTELSTDDGWPFNDLALVLDKLGQHDEAEEAFKRALTIAPGNAMIHRNLGWHYLSLEEFAKAEAEFTVAESIANRWGIIRGFL
jgi:tetratricopeptide (TPR) repeat protein